MSVKLTPSSSEPTIVFDRPILILVEGYDDQAFAERQILEVSDGSDWHVHFVSGKSAGWVDIIQLALESEQFSESGRAVAIILDADQNAEAAADKARSMFDRSDLPVPGAHGVLAADDRWKTAFFVMPDGTQQGALENLLLGSFEEKRMQLASDYISRVEREVEVPKNRAKAVLQAYFAAQVKHVKTLRVAVSQREIIPPDHGVFAAFKAFLCALDRG